MGTSDTIFSICAAGDSRPGLEGHFFVNPVDPASHMAMLCYKNGSLAREAVCEEVTGKKGDWATFGKLLDSTAPGNGGNLGFFVFHPEIIPKIPREGVRRFDPSGVAVDSFSPEVEARAIIEGQFLSYVRVARASTIVCASGWK
jgi:xylulokinase